MKIFLHNACRLFFLGIFLLSGCTKDEDPEVESNSKHSYNYNGAAGILVASKSYTYDLNGGYLNAIEAHTASAVFPTAPGASTYNYAGIVKVQGKELTPTTSNLYNYINKTDPVILTGDINWAIGGGNNVPAFSFSQNKGIPYFNGLAELAVVIAKGSGAIVDLWGKAGYADSVSVTISGAGKTVSKTVPGTAQNLTFQPSELSGLKATKNATWTVTSFNYRDALIEGKHYYFINETSYFKINVEIL